MSRVTKEQLQRAVERLNKELGRPTAPYTHKKDEEGKASLSVNVGCIVLDHAPIYGGYCLYEMSEGGGQSNFGFTRGRQPAKVMYEIIWGIIHGIKEGKKMG